ncbi:MAG TPA: co-chaperone DjlA [Steroidobacteraceae bacterium]|nr:co-chaperone DjlA [Steroidobacteraceae bacterium]
MGWNGKIIGGAIGFVLGGPLWALLGLFVGHQLDSSGAAAAQPGPGAAARVQELFFPATFRVMGHIAKADGRVSEQEINAARAVMVALHLNSAQVRQAIAYYTEGKQQDFSLETALQELQPLLRAFPQLAQFFMEIQLQASLAGNGLGATPRARLLHAGRLLGLTGGDFARLEALMRWRMNGAPPAGGASAQAQTDQLQQAYTLLEVSSAAADEQVVKAYRRQMSRNHPDKLQANGLPESMLERAKERTQQIQAAYELIRSARGMR